MYVLVVWGILNGKLHAMAFQNLFYDKAGCEVVKELALEEAKQNYEKTDAVCMSVPKTRI